MKQPEFSPQSVVDLRGILGHISGDKPRAAEEFVVLLKEKCYFLARTPLAGTSRDELSPGLRCYSVGNYVIFFHPTDHGIRVERVLHGARDVDLVFGEESD